MFRCKTTLKILFGLVYTNFKNTLTRKKKITRKKKKKKTHALGFESTTTNLTVLNFTTALLATMIKWPTCNVNKVLKMSSKVSKMPTCRKTMR